MGGITVEFSVPPPGTDYEVNLILPSGETINLQCGSNSNQVAFEKTCSESGVFFALASDVAPPSVITIEVIAEGRTYSQEFSPVYEKSQPNGEDCPPVCYNANLTFHITQ